MPKFNVRLDALCEANLDRMVAQTGKTKSAVVREALARYVEKAEKKLKKLRSLSRSEIKPDHSSRSSIG